MDYLPMLRMNNVFPRNRATDRPFGMPEIDSGNLGEVLRQVGPLASNLNDDEMRRKKELMRFEASLNQNPSRGRGINPRANLDQMRRPQTIGGDYQMPKQVIAGPGAAGPTMMQKRFHEDETTQRAQRFKSQLQGEEYSSRYKQAMDERQLQEASHGERTQQEIAGRRDVTSLEGDMRARLEAEKTRQAIEAAKVAHTNRMAVEGERGNQQRLTNKQRPDQTPQTGKDMNDNLNFRLRSLGIDYPELNEIIIKDADGVPTGVNMDRLDPDSRRAVQNYLSGNKTVQTPNAQAGNPREGATRKLKKGNQTKTQVFSGGSWKDQ